MPWDRPRVPHDVIFFDFLLFLGGLEPHFFTFFVNFRVRCWCGVVWCWCWCVVLYGGGVWCCMVLVVVPSAVAGVGRRHWDNISLGARTRAQN